MEEFRLVDRTHQDAAPHRYRKVGAALRFLKKHCDDPDKIEHMRDLWQGLKKHRKSSGQPSEKELLNTLAEQLVSGSLRPIEETRAGGGGGRAKEKPDPAPPRHRTQPIFGRTSTDKTPLLVRPRSTPAEPAPVEAQLNEALQVKALLTAAKNGAAFCKVCNE